MRSRTVTCVALIALLVIVAILLVPMGVSAEGPTIDPQSGTVGSVFTFTASGFAPGETVALWISKPGGEVESQGNIAADGSGAVSVLIVPTAEWQFGFYLQVAHGMRSKYEASILFEYYNPGRGESEEGSRGCSPGVFIAGGFTAGERVAAWYGAPNGTVAALPALSADATGVVNTTFTTPTPGLVGPYDLVVQGYSSKLLARHTFFWQGGGFTGQGDCGGATLSDGSGGVAAPTPGAPGGGGVGQVPKSVGNFMGPGVYLNTDPEATFYFDCGYKWRPMGGDIYFDVLGFAPNEQVDVSYEILLEQGRTPYTTLTANEWGNVRMHINDATWNKGHYHWWFASKTKTYCGHYDPYPQ